ncbi:MAG: pirin family protein [Burkholderiales bacterium]|nr:pirin family protein [Burkholderiales bacterium]
MPANPVLDIAPLGFPWPTVDPFLFCVHHDDRYPPGNAQMGPAASLAGRALGQDFAGKDGWRMYHGTTVPGFPAHPHRGFETVTIVRRGLIDHSDSLGAAARFGHGDVQWLTAGRGIVHAEMFPLLARDAGNPLELFQIWLNLPARNKMAPPHFRMLWAGDLPRRAWRGPNGAATEVTCIAGAWDDLQPPAPPPHSWAADADADLAIWTIRLDPGAVWTLPAARGAATRRCLYLFSGAGASFGGQAVPAGSCVALDASAPVELANGAAPSELLMLQGRPIGEPVAQAGPFVMNTEAEVRQAFADYRATGFGGWPWPDAAPVHGRDPGRFARHADGRVERA